MLLAVLSVAVLALADAPVRSVALDPEAPAETPPAVVRSPTLDEVADLYPRRARARGVEGRAVIECRVTLAGGLDACFTYTETPAEMGFGDAALALAPLVGVRPGTINGEKVSGQVVRLPFVFRLPGGPLPGLDETLRCHGLLAAHSALTPRDLRLRQAADLAGLRADELMTSAEVDADERTQRLATARAAAPRPKRAAATEDPCFMAFVQ